MFPIKLYSANLKLDFNVGAKSIRKLTRCEFTAAFTILKIPATKRNTFPFYTKSSIFCFNLLIFVEIVFCQCNLENLLPWQLACSLSTFF